MDLDWDVFLLLYDISPWPSKEDIDIFLEGDEDRTLGW